MRSVDNEALGLGFFDHDLARSWYRWPLPSEGWRAFAGHYRAATGARTEASAPTWAFWRVLVVTGSAHLRRIRIGHAYETALDRLRELAAELEP